MQTEIKSSIKMDLEVLRKPVVQCPINGWQLQSYCGERGPWRYGFDNPCPFYKGMADNTTVVKKEYERWENLSLREYIESETPEDIKEHWKHEQSDEFFQIWGKNLPETDFTFGSFSAYRLNQTPYNLLFMFLAHEAGIKEYIISSFHHGSNWGECQFFKSQDPLDIQLISMCDNEKEKYGKFSLRVEKEVDFPIKKLHQYVNGTSGPIPWEFSSECLVSELGKSEFSKFLEDDFFTPA